MGNTKANSGPKTKPLQSSSAIYKRLPCFSSVLLTYFLSSTLHAQFTAVYPIWRLCWPSLKTVTKLPENLQRPEGRLKNKLLIIYHWLSVSRPWCESLLSFIVYRNLFSVRYDLGLKKSYIERTTTGSNPMYEINAWNVFRTKQGP